MLAPGEVDQHIQVGRGVIETVDERATPLRAAMTAMVERIDRITQLGKLECHTLVAATVLTGAV